MKVTIQSKDGLRVADLNRRRAIRERCLNCVCWVSPEVDRCPFRDCSLHPFRSGRGKQDPKERGRAIKAYCLWCMAGQQYEIAKCTSPHCPLFAFRGSRKNVTECPDLLSEHHGERIFETIRPEHVESVTGRE